MSGEAYRAVRVAWCHARPARVRPFPPGRLETGREALKLGAFDYIVKPLNLETDNRGPTTEQ